MDFSTSSGDALRLAQSLASALGASIEVLHVMDPSDTMLDRIADRPSGGDPAAARGLLRDFVAALGSGSVPITERIEQGEPQSVLWPWLGTRGSTSLSWERSAAPDGRWR